MLHAPVVATQTTEATGHTKAAPLPAHELHPQLASLTDRRPASIRQQPAANLQATYGNQAVLRALKRPSPSAGAIIQRKCACGSAAGMDGECDTCRKKRLGLQTKLKVNEPGDVYEQEADRVADQVMAAAPLHSVSGTRPRIQRLSAQSAGQVETTPPSVSQTLANPGRPLEPSLRQDMELRFGHDFSLVRIHSDAIAAQSARDVNAYAYTAGHNIVFGSSAPPPTTHEGRRLLAHELTHVVQQTQTHSQDRGSVALAINTKAEQCAITSASHTQPRPTTDVSADRVSSQLSACRAIQRSPITVPPPVRKQIKRIILDKNRSEVVFVLEGDSETLQVRDHCDPKPGNYTAKVVNKATVSEGLSFRTDQNVGCTIHPGYIYHTIGFPKKSTLKGVQSLDFQVVEGQTADRDGEMQGRVQGGKQTVENQQRTGKVETQPAVQRRSDQEIWHDIQALPKYIQDFLNDPGSSGSPDISGQDLEKAARAGLILKEAGVTEDDLLLQRQRRIDWQGIGKRDGETADLEAWAQSYSNYLKQTRAASQANATDLLAAARRLSQTPPDIAKLLPLLIKVWINGPYEEVIMRFLPSSVAQDLKSTLRTFEKALLSDLRLLITAVLDQTEAMLIRTDAQFAGKWKPYKVRRGNLWDQIQKAKNDPEITKVIAEHEQHTTALDQQIDQQYEQNPMLFLPSGLLHTPEIEQAKQRLAELEAENKKQQVQYEDLLRQTLAERSRLKLSRVANVEVLLAAEDQDEAYRLFDEFLDKGRTKVKDARQELDNDKFLYSADRIIKAEKERIAKALGSDPGGVVSMVIDHLAIERKAQTTLLEEILELLEYVAMFVPGPIGWMTSLGFAVKDFDATIRNDVMQGTLFGVNASDKPGDHAGGVALLKLAFDIFTNIPGPTKVAEPLTSGLGKSLEKRSVTEVGEAAAREGGESAAKAGDEVATHVPTSHDTTAVRNGEEVAPKVADDAPTHAPSPPAQNVKIPATPLDELRPSAKKLGIEPEKLRSEVDDLRLHTASPDNVRKPSDLHLDAEMTAQGHKFERNKSQRTWCRSTEKKCDLDLGHGLNSDVDSAISKRDAAAPGLGEQMIKDERKSGLNVDIAAQEHRHKTEFRKGSGIDVQSAHLVNSSSVSDISDYVRDHALTALLPAKQHKAFDDYWKKWARDRLAKAKPGEDVRVTVAEWERVLNDAAESVLELRGRTADTMSVMIRHELYQTLELEADQLIRLPYSR